MILSSSLPTTTPETPATTATTLPLAQDQDRTSLPHATMERLCDDILQLIFAELDEPADFAASSRHLYAFSRDPYVRANYFLARHGRLQALFWAFWRGRVLNPKVIDTLLTCGAHVSRYLAQVAMGHYFRTQAPFIKGPWVRTVDYQTFTYFLGKAGELFGNIPPEKGKDDGTLFTTFLEESRSAKTSRDVKWEDVKDILGTYKFIPFCPKDPLMAQFPLALSVEPRLLPFALANGFRMDCKYRDFVFRRMFEKRYGGTETQADDIVQHARDLCRLDKRMFLSRTVAAEICMDAKFNEPAFTALKRLHQSGDLLFDLGMLVEDLIKLFSGSRAMTHPSTSTAAHHLYNAFPSSDPVVRHVLLVSLFHSDTLAMPNSDSEERAAAVREKLEPLKLGPVSRAELISVLADPFIERSDALVDYAQVELKMKKGELKLFVQEAACRSLEEASKGTALKIFLGANSWLKPKLVEYVWDKHRMRVDNLPPVEDEQACTAFQAKLARKMVFATEKPRARSNPVQPVDGPVAGPGLVAGGQTAEEGAEESDISMEVDDAMGTGISSTPLDLGDIGLETLSNAIKKDEMDTRGRRRGYWTWYLDREIITAKETHPPGAVSVAKWVYSTYGARSPITAMFMDHAIINGNEGVIREYLGMDGWPIRVNSSKAVPLTLKHFQMLARLGREPSYEMWHQLQHGMDFYASEDDYLGQEPVKKEDLWESPPGLLVSSEERPSSKTTDSASCLPGPSQGGSSPLTSAAASPEPPSRKRPRRSATNHVKSYIIPDSDDEDIADEADECRHYFSGSAAPEKERKSKKQQETNLQIWIRHLTILQKEEQHKYKEKRRRAETQAQAGKKTRTPKSAFFKSLNDRLRTLEQHANDERGPTLHDKQEEDSYSEPEDEREYRDTSFKRRRRA